MFVEKTSRPDITKAIPRIHRWDGIVSSNLQTPSHTSKQSIEIAQSNDYPPRRTCVPSDDIIPLGNNNEQQQLWKCILCTGQVLHISPRKYMERWIYTSFWSRALHFGGWAPYPRITWSKRRTQCDGNIHGYYAQQAVSNAVVTFQWVSVIGYLHSEIFGRDVPHLSSPYLRKAIGIVLTWQIRDRRLTLTHSNSKPRLRYPTAL